MDYLTFAVVAAIGAACCYDMSEPDDVSEAEPGNDATRAVQARVAVVQDRTPNHTGEPQ